MNEKNIEKLMELAETKRKLKNALKEYLKDAQNYEKALNCYNEYAMKYKDITQQNPSEGFEELIEKLEDMDFER